MKALLKFAKLYVLSMRLHFGFITAIAGWTGISFYEYLHPQIKVDLGIKIFMLVAIFLAYGVNQVINDFFGIEEDKINAPHRPMVTGELNKYLAVTVSIVSMLLLGIVAFFIAPLSVIPLIAGVVLNIIYEYAKAISILGNIIFGMSMTVCPIFGYLVAGPIIGDLVTVERLIALALMVFITGRMTFFTYFKDYQGDKATGKKTFVVTYGPEFASKVGIFLALVPTIFLLILIGLNIVSMQQIADQTVFIFCFLIALFTQIWSAALYYKYPDGERTYHNLKTAIQGCVVSQTVFIAVYNGQLALALMLASYILIDFIFGFHSDPKA